MWGGPLPWDVLGAFAHRRIGMPTGTIARLLIDKGFGFIRDEGGIEHFFHRSSVRGAVFELLREGQRVEFTDRKSTRLNSSHSQISYAVFCLKKKNIKLHASDMFPDTCID